MKKEDRVKQFLEGLTRLSRKTGIVVEGCGCCGSPWVEDNSKDGTYRLLEEGGYNSVIFEEKEKRK